MRTRRLALTAAAVAVLAAAATACGPENGDGGSAEASPVATAAATAAATPTAPAAAPSKATSPSGSASASTATSASAAASAPGTKSGSPGQNCATKDLTFTTRTESQAGGFILITAKARPGVSCTLPGPHATIAFGSGGIEAVNAEQAVGTPITLGGDKVAYAGVNPKSTKGNQEIEFTDVIVAVGKADPDPVSLPVGPTKVDKPVVTNWHTVPKDAVPGI
ncbi:hypothetical protein [Streptomyces sp. BE303]|uniref:hypothetical protein n=1 Tax=Streptomyces sp. BE303 TaxID=3002528 RepID=UPI002E7A701F|nr:hypothetical protein [Streptomyces sp. BE303]MED7949246.1 hypothetical protein [Streptomyces sp. BE303]